MKFQLTLLLIFFSMPLAGYADNLRFDYESVHHRAERGDDTNVERRHPVIVDSGCDVRIPIHSDCKNTQRKGQDAK